MKENPCNKMTMTANKSIIDSLSGKIKKNWRKPTLMEVDYSLTSELGGTGSDLATESES